MRQNPLAELGLVQSALMAKQTERETERERQVERKVIHEKLLQVLKKMDRTLSVATKLLKKHKKHMIYMSSNLYAKFPTTSYYNSRDLCVQTDRKA